MSKAKVVSEKVKEVADKGAVVAKNVASHAKKHGAKAAEIAKPVGAFAKTIPAKTQVLYKNTFGDEPAKTSTLSKISFWSGLASIPFGFPANVIAIASAATVEDRRKIVAKEGYKTAVAALVVPKAAELLRSRIGLVAGGVSIALTIVGIIVIAKKQKALAETLENFEESQEVDLP